jgi:Fe-S-cluster containining protein
MTTSAELVSADLVTATRASCAACGGECEKPPADVELVHANDTDTLAAFAKDMKPSAELVSAELVAATCASCAACGGECEKPPADVELVHANDTDKLAAFAKDMKPLQTGGLVGNRSTVDCQLSARGDLIVTAYTGVAAAPFSGPMLLAPC